MKNLFLKLASIALLAAGCQMEVNGPAVEPGPTDFLASCATFDENSKTSMDSDRNVLWSEGDQIAIFRGYNVADLYGVTSETAGTNMGTFELVTDKSGSTDNKLEISTNVAVYPYADALTCSTFGKTSFVIHNAVIPTEQAYTANSFTNNAMLMAAVTQEPGINRLNFKNVLGAIKLQLTGTDIVKSIRIEGNNNEFLSGKAIVTVHKDGSAPDILLESGAKTYAVLDCGTGVRLNKKEATEFIIVLPPVTFSNGFKVTVTKADNTTATLEAKQNEILRSSILRMPVRDITSNVQPVHLTFRESDEDIANPERGFYFCQSFKKASASLLTANKIAEKRLKNMTICYLGFYPKEYINGHISEDYLQMVRKNMQILRENGAKCIMRFAYSDSEDEKPWDPTPEVVQMHIADIKPILQEYSDVIMCLQAGFVGVWGEWYYTDNFDYEGGNDNYELRKQVVDAMLAALPSERSVALRTPLFKKMMYAGSYSNTLTDKTAYNGSALARIGSFNDCFGASSSDYGTFNSEDDRTYWKNESKYTLMGGETCGVSEYCECEVSISDMEDYHWTYLNDEYNHDVHNVWKNGGCWNEVKLRLGYRLSLTDVYHSAGAYAGENFNVKVNIRNTGFAAPMNPRDVELVLVDGNGTKTIYDLSNDVDPRYWFAGDTYTIDTSITLPANAKGECTLYLNLPDPKTTLHDNPYFSIRLANEEDIWEEETGYNKLFEFTLGTTVLPEPEPEPEITPNTEGSASGENISYGNQYNPWN